jgi:ribose-phosphate pyrophosphokinase
MTIIFSFPGSEQLVDKIITKLSYQKGNITTRRFPDGESYLRINDDVKAQDIVIIASLDHPDDKIMPLLFFAKTCRELGAKKITLVAPYLGYMRQDIRFKAGEAVTSDIFAQLISQYFDTLITIDPHLHRHKTLGEIYTIPTKIIHAANAVTKWIKDNVKKPLLIGPDEESQQWVHDMAEKTNAPFLILEKVRHGDKDVEISVPEVKKFADHTPILVDDIISTGRTMIETMKHLQKAKMLAPICIGVHAIFADDAYINLQNAGASKIISCNTIPHPSNNIDMSGDIIEALTHSR